VTGAGRSVLGPEDPPETPAGPESEILDVAVGGEGAERYVVVELVLGAAMITVLFRRGSARLATWISPHRGMPHLNRLDDATLDGADAVARP